MHVAPVTVDGCLCEAKSRGWENGTYVPEERADRSKGTVQQTSRTVSRAAGPAWLPSFHPIRLCRGSGQGRG